MINLILKLKYFDKLKKLSKSIIEKNRFVEPS